MFKSNKQLNSLNFRHLIIDNYDMVTEQNMKANIHKFSRIH